MVNINKDERIILHYVRSAYETLKDYETKGLDADGKNINATEILLWRQDIIMNINHYESMINGYLDLMRKDPVKFGFTPSKLEEMASEIDRIKSMVLEERKIELEKGLITDHEPYN